MKKSRVFVDGALIGLVEDPTALVRQIRQMRRAGGISTEINVSFKEYNGDVIIHTDRGRARRPLIVIENGRPLLTDEDLGRLERKEVDFGDLVQRGLVEFIDAEEEEDLFIAINEDQLTPEHTHLEIDPSLILGIGAAHVPFPEHNASPRVTMGAGMVKQALGFGSANMKLRPDTRGHLLHYVQKPLVHTQTSDDRLGRPAGRPELRGRHPQLRRVQHRGCAHLQQGLDRPRARTLALLPDLRGRGAAVPRRPGRPDRDPGRGGDRRPR